MTASLDRDASAKLSPYLAIGCLSPRMVHAALAQHRQRAADGGAGSGHAYRGGGAAAASAGGTAHAEQAPLAPMQSGSGHVRIDPASCSDGSATSGGGRRGGDSLGHAEPGNPAGDHVVGAGVEPGPAPDAEDGAATLAMHLQIRRARAWVTVAEGPLPPPPRWPCTCRSGARGRG